MANFKICVRQQRDDKLFPVYIRITHNRKVGYIKTDKVIITSKLRKREPLHRNMRDIITSIRQDVAHI